MATPYEVEHNIKPGESGNAPGSRRHPDFSTFFATLELSNLFMGDDEPHNNPNAVPTPHDVSAAFRSLAEAFEHMNGNDLLALLIGELREEAESPPTVVKGVPDSYFDTLERVDKKEIKKGDKCPICDNAFLDDEYPLVVRLPCHKTHLFDLECIQPWLKLHSTCPLDRKDILKHKPDIPVTVSDEEEVWDENYG